MTSDKKYCLHTHGSLSSIQIDLLHNLTTWYFHYNMVLSQCVIIYIYVDDAYSEVINLIRTLLKNNFNLFQLLSFITNYIMGNYFPLVHVDTKFIYDKLQGRHLETLLLMDVLKPP